jgi:hypothetical protein
MDNPGAAFDAIKNRPAPGRVLQQGSQYQRAAIGTA